MPGTRAPEGNVDSRTAGILDGMPDGFIALDRDGRCTYVNPEGARLVGRSREEISGSSVVLFTDGSSAGVDRELARAAADHTTVEFDFYHAPSHRWLEVRSCPAPDGSS